MPSEEALCCCGLSDLFKMVFNMLNPFMIAEFWLLWGVEKEQRKLQSMLSQVKANLKDAEELHVTDNAASDWLGKLKDAAYDAEDLVDEFKTEKATIRDSMRKKVSNFFSTSDPLVFQYEMAHKMKDLRERFDEIAKERGDFRLPERFVGSRPPILTTRETHSRVIESEVYGRDDEKVQIIDSLLNLGNERGVSVIAIVGVGGLGKTTLAQLVYNDKTVITHFDLQMWVYVSEVFDVRRLVKEILQSAMEGTSDQLSLDQLQARLQKKLSGKKYLIVLDDVWNEDCVQWDQLKTLLICGTAGSKILVTTRNHGVVSTMRTLSTCYLRILSKDDCWSLFEHLAFEHEQGRQRNLVSIGKEIVSKCGGVPLAIKTLGSLLYSKTSEDYWLSVKDSEIWEFEDKDRGILPALRLSYNHLASPLKQCFAYCAVFPKGQPIDKDKLIKQWIAQGFIQSYEGDEILEKKGDHYFDHFLWRSFFQDAKKDHIGNVISCKMHDIVHDLARFVAGTECSIVEARYVEESECPIVEDRTKTIHETTRHMLLCPLEWKNVEPMKKCKKLRSILSPYPLGSRWDVDINVYLSFMYLRVLDISQTDINFLPIPFGKLKLLSYLDLSSTEIRKLPETFCNLQNLQTLKLFRTPIRKLPNDMKRMTSLRHIEFDNAFNYKISLPNGIGELTCLQTLPIFTVSEDSGSGIEELKGLNLLRGTLHIERLHNIVNAECAREVNLNEKQHLISLILSWGDVDDIRGNSEKVLEYLKSHSNLKSLQVESYMGPNFPRWGTLKNLVDISLINCKNCEHLPPLGQLPSLESINMVDMDAVKYIVEFDRGYNDKDIIFSSLKQLKLSNMPNLEGWSSLPSDDGLFPCLQMLDVYDCPQLARFPRCIPALEVYR